MSTFLFSTSCFDGSLTVNISACCVIILLPTMLSTMLKEHQVRQQALRDETGIKSLSILLGLWLTSISNRDQEEGGNQIGWSSDKSSRGGTLRNKFSVTNPETCFE